MGGTFSTMVSGNFLKLRVSVIKVYVADSKPALEIRKYLTNKINKVINKYEVLKSEKNAAKNFYKAGVFVSESICLEICRICLEWELECFYISYKHSSQILNTLRIHG